MRTANFRVGGDNPRMRLRNDRLLQPPRGIEILQGPLAVASAAASALARAAR